ncbi:MAG: biotin and thiamine synthesis associated [Oscillospiraceae bacterium]|jgi:2-iminoacetate synthase|nr:biotin and thiamine synthesis associated [Oscillospiraceae bacterium]
MYNSKSQNAEEFIDHEEILSSLDFGKKNKNNTELINEALEQAAQYKGLSHKQVAMLIECNDADTIDKIYRLAEQVKLKIYGKRIVLFAPLYLSNYCVNGCKYCAYHASNCDMKRKKLSQEEIIQEVTALQDMGHKRLALETGEDPVNSPIEYVLESIKTIYGIKHKNGAIRRVNVNIAATTVENYQKLRDAGIGTYVLFQETYHKPTYELMHPKGPKHNYAYHTEAMDRAMTGGIDDVGIGALLGLYDYKYDTIAMMLHIKHLEDTFGVGPHTISVPRIRPADDVDVNIYPNSVPDDEFKKIVAVLRLAVPYTGIIISTRESAELRAEVIKLGVSQISGGSSTDVGGYAETEHQRENTAQFEVNDHRTLDEIVNWLSQNGYVPSFCTACYREGRTGERFMALAKTGQIGNVCQANALITLKEYLEDYAQPQTKQNGEKLIYEQVEVIPNPKVKVLTKDYLEKIYDGQRDFRF